MIMLRSFLKKSKKRRAIALAEHWAYLTVETQDMCLVESQDICLVETQDMCCVESKDMCFVQSQYKAKGGSLRPPPFVEAAEGRL